MEDDTDIFNSVLQPLILQGVSEGFKKQRIDAGQAATDDEEEAEEEDEPMIDIVARNRFCA
jgi:hypothetical protein